MGAAPDPPVSATLPRPATPGSPASPPGPDTPTLRFTPAGTPSIPVDDGSRYSIEGELGRGGMGIVYRAFDRRLRRHVALKVVLGGRGPEDDARFAEEAQA